MPSPPYGAHSSRPIHTTGPRPTSGWRTEACSRHFGRTSCRFIVAEAVIHTGYSCLEYWVPVICFVCHCSSQFSHCSALSFDVRFHYVIFQSIASARGNVNARPITFLLATICEWTRLSTYSRILPLWYVIGQESN